WINMANLPRSRLPVTAAWASDANTMTLAPITSSMLQSTRRSLNRVASRWSVYSWVRRLVKRSIIHPASPKSRNHFLAGRGGEPEEPQLFAGRRVHGDLICIMSVALRPANCFGIAVAPDRAFAQKPVCRQPCAGQHNRCPPGISGKHRSGCQTAYHVDQAASD